MMWKEIYPNLVSKKSKHICVDFALACFKKADEENNVRFFYDMSKLNDDVKSRDAMKVLVDSAAKIRVNAESTSERETAHIALHAFETALATNHISASGHAARCAEALSRINEGYAIEIKNRFEI